MKKIACILFFLLITHALYADEYNVYPGGIPSDICSQASQPGDIIYIHEGTYDDPGICNLSSGVSIVGQGAVVLNISTQRYIRAMGPGPGNVIEGISFVGTGTNDAIWSEGRSNQKIRHNRFTNFRYAIWLSGKRPRFILECDDYPTESAVCCNNNIPLSTQPEEGDWADGIEIHHNIVVNGQIKPHTIRGSVIHNNTVDNSGEAKSAFGHTSYWWDSVEFHHNEINLMDNSVIGCEVWYIQNDCRFYDNTSNGWFSLIRNPNGMSTPYSYRFYNNKMISGIPYGRATAYPLEITSFIRNVLVENNLFETIGESGFGWKYGIGTWAGVVSNITIRGNVFKNIHRHPIMISAADHLVKPNRRAEFTDWGIYNNVFMLGERGYAAIRIFDYTQSGRIKDISIRKNTVIDGDLVKIIPDDNNVENIVIHKNIIVGGLSLTGMSIVNDRVSVLNNREFD